jgi:hypothetical protein
MMKERRCPSVRVLCKSNPRCEQHTFSLNLQLLYGTGLIWEYKEIGEGRKNYSEESKQISKRILSINLLCCGLQKLTKKYEYVVWSHLKEKIKLPVHVGSTS